MRSTDKKRFMAKVRVEGGHWIWTAGQQFRHANGDRTTPLHAAMNLYGKGCPKGWSAFNRCGVVGCVQPRHGIASEVSCAATLSALYVPLRGEANPCVVLNAAAVIDLRRRAAAGESVMTDALAGSLGVSRTALSNAVTGERWAHIEEATTRLPVGGRRERNTRWGNATKRIRVA